MKALYLLLSLFVSALLFGNPTEFQKPSVFDETIWEDLEPYFLPFDHPLRKRLDKIFTQGRITTNLVTLKEAGFKYLPLRKWNNIVVCWHSKLRGYLLKLYLDDQVGFPDWPNWKSRIFGARVISDSIDKFGYHHMFKVPGKWIYPLPLEHQSFNPDRNFILVVEDMQTIGTQENYRFWRSSGITRDILEKTYEILSDAGLYDSMHVDNIPFCRDGRFAFIDTEHWHWWPVKYEVMSKYFNKKNQTRWQEIINSH